MNIMNYKEYAARIEYSEEDDCFAEVFTNLDGSQTLVVGDYMPFDQETEIGEQDKFIASMYE